nr:reverse transcriptase domain-containing protein [Tanacetum cinerariifolium]
MPFGLCNASGTFQRCMMAIFHDMIGKTIEVFMDDFSVFGNSFQTCLSHLEKMLKRCEYTNIYLNWVKSHFMVKEGIFLGHKISKNRIKVDKAKVDVIAKLPHPTIVKGVYMANKPLTFSRHATMDPPRDIMAQTTLPRSVKERFRNVMKCHKIPSKFANFLTFRASTSWAHSRLHEAINIYSWLSTTCRNGLKRKRSPPMTPELFANSLNLSLPDLELPVPSSVIAVRTSAMTSLQSHA